MTKVRDVMSVDVITVHVDTPFKELVATLLDHDVSGVPVLDDAGQLVGIVTEADLLSKEAYGGQPRPRLLGFVHDLLLGVTGGAIHKASGLTAEDVMSFPVVATGPDEEVRDAARRMVRRGIKRLPVVKDGVVVGMVSRHDVLRVFERSDDDIERTVRSLLGRSLFVPPDHDIAVKVTDGVVTLEGVVRYESDARIAGALTESLDGVVAIENRLLFLEPDPRMTV